MKNSEYIHINEAANIYNKTRQTFYNYIKRGLIASKKINNKVYLKREDIEKITSDYIHINENISGGYEEIISPEEMHDYEIYHQVIPEENEQKQINTVNKKNAFEASFQKDLLRLHKQYYHLKDELVQEVKRSKQDILFDTKAMNYNQEQRIINHISQRFKEMKHQEKQINKTISTLYLKNKKISFWIGYTVILLLQLILGNFLL